MYSEIIKNFKIFPFQVELMENTCITKKENYLEVIKYYKHKPRDRENSPSTQSLLRFLWKQILPCCDVGLVL